MPKKVDHDARRRLIAEALLRVAAESGLEAVSLRHVAAEAGVTSGMVQHYFHTKDEMMAFALAVVGENITARLADEGLGDSPSPGELVRALLVQFLPLDDARRNEGRVSLAFLAYAAVNPAVGAMLRNDSALMRAYVADQIRASGGGRTIDPMSAATALLALVEGLAMSVVAGYYDPATALAAFDDHLELFFGPSRPVRPAPPR